LIRKDLIRKDLIRNHIPFSFSLFLALPCSLSGVFVSKLNLQQFMRWILFVKEVQYPKLHFHLVFFPVLLSVKTTFNGFFPESSEPLKFATEIRC